MKRSLLLVGIWFAQAVPASAADIKAADPAAPSPGVTYRSGFDGYKPFRDEAIGDWRGLNSDVREIGGHAGIFRSGTGASEKAQEQPTGPTPPAQGQPPLRGAPEAPAGQQHH